MMVGRVGPGGTAGDPPWWGPVSRGGLPRPCPSQSPASRGTRGALWGASGEIESLCPIARRSLGDYTCNMGTSE